MELFDLTQPLGPDLSIQPGDPPLTLLRTSSHEIHGYEVTRVCMGSHTGTHVDAPRHFFPQASTVDHYAPDRFIGPGVVLDCRSPRVTGTGEGVAEQLRRFSFPAGGSVLLWTEGALVTLATACVLVGAGARLVGTDAPSLDEEPYPVHRYLLGSDVLIVENLWHLARLGAGPVNCALLPLALVGTDGAPVRAVAWRTTEPEQA